MQVIDAMMLESEQISCPFCGAEMEVEECWYCGGEGGVDEYDDDPINFSPGAEYFECIECCGTGFLRVCPNAPHEKREEKI